MGWDLFLLFLFLLLKSNWSSKKRYTILKKIGAIIVIFILIAQAIFFIVLKNCDATIVAKDFAKKNQNLISNIGEIENLCILPQGTISESSYHSKKTGYAEINMIAKGSKKFLDILVILRKEAEENWKVVEMEIY